MSDSGVVLVTGASGLVGRAVVARLHEQGVGVRAMSRHPAAAGWAAGVEPVAADLEDPAGWAAALRGITGVFLYPRGRTAAFVAAAAAAGVRRVVTLSSATITVRDRYPSAVADHHAAVETAVDDTARTAGLLSAHLRPVPFDANTLSWAPAIREAGAVRLAYPQARYAAVDESDIADVAVADLLDPPPSGTVRHLTGPHHISRREQVEAIARATGRPLRTIEITPETAVRELLAAGHPRTVAATAVEHMARAVTEPDPVTDTVPDVLGRPARSYTEWLQDNLHVFQPGSRTAR